MSEYRYRWHCSACHETGEWHETPDGAKLAVAEHIETHDEVLYEPTEIQRYPVGDINE